MSAPYYADDSVTVHHGDCLDVLRTLPDNSVDAVVCDPPYGLADTTPEQVADTLIRWVNGERDYLPSGKGFMGKEWDGFVPPVAVWDDCLRVLKPGGHLLAFAGSRTQDLMGLAIRLAGFEVRDSIAWLYGSGFPKSLDVSKAIDKAAGATPIVLGPDEYRRARANRGTTSEIQPSYDKPREAQAEANITAPATPAAQQWQGWGTALKPAFEPIVVARKPLVGTVAANVLAHGTGALNIDGCRVAHGEPAGKPHVGNGGARSGGIMGAVGADRVRETTAASTAGRWPANVLLDGDMADALDAVGPRTRDGVASPKSGGFGRGMFGDGTADNMGAEGFGGEGGPSRFFPVFRDDAHPAAAVEMVEGTLRNMEGASEDWKEERITALLTENFPEEVLPTSHVRPSEPDPFSPTDYRDPRGDESSQAAPALPTFRYQAKAPTRERPSYVKDDGTKIAHPTVKPKALMSWLVRLVTPPGGICLDPFAGSGTTIEAAITQGFRCVAIEREADYLPLILERIRRCQTATPASDAAVEALTLFDEEPTA